MSAESEANLQEFLECIIRKTSGRIVKWIKPEIAPLMTPDVRAIIPVAEQAINTTLESQRAYLRGYDRDYIFLAFSDAGKATDDQSRIWQERESAKAEQLATTIPIWVQAALGRSDMLADFDYWSKVAFFEINEALWLSLGYEPTVLLKSVLRERKPGNLISSTMQEFFMKRLDLFVREFDPHDFSKRIGPTELLNWVERVELEIHPGFRTMMAKMVPTKSFGATSKVTKIDVSTGTTDKFEAREKVSLAKILVAIAIQEYGYDPTSRKSPIPAEIVNIAASLGITISPDTIRNYLQMGARYLPEGWKPNSD